MCLVPKAYLHWQLGHRWEHTLVNTHSRDHVTAKRASPLPLCDRDLESQRISGTTALGQILQCIPELCIMQCFWGALGDIGPHIKEFAGINKTAILKVGLTPYTGGTSG